MVTDITAGKGMMNEAGATNSEAQPVRGSSHLNRSSLPNVDARSSGMKTALPVKKRQLYRDVERANALRHPPAMKEKGCAEAKNNRPVDEAACHSDDVEHPNAKKSKPVAPAKLKPAPFFYYTDYSREEDDDPLTPLTPMARVPNFPAKMHAILARPDLIDVIAWMPHGRSWKIVKPRQFEIRVLPTYFDHAKFSSFIRQANGWGFRRITHGRDRNTYYHELFLRGLPHLCKRMRRPAVSEKTALNPEHEPNFAEISKLHPVPDKLVGEDDSILLEFTVENGPRARMPVHGGLVPPKKTPSKRVHEDNKEDAQEDRKLPAGPPRKTMVANTTRADTGAVCVPQFASPSSGVVHEDKSQSQKCAAAMPGSGENAVASASNASSGLLLKQAVTQRLPCELREPHFARQLEQRLASSFMQSQRVSSVLDRPVSVSASSFTPKAGGGGQAASSVASSTPNTSVAGHCLSVQPQVTVPDIRSGISPWTVLMNHPSLKILPSVEHAAPSSLSVTPGLNTLPFANQRSQTQMDISPQIDVMAAVSKVLKHRQDRATEAMLREAAVAKLRRENDAAQALVVELQRQEVLQAAVAEAQRKEVMQAALVEMQRNEAVQTQLQALLDVVNNDQVAFPSTATEQLDNQRGKLSSNFSSNWNVVTDKT